MDYQFKTIKKIEGSENEDKARGSSLTKASSEEKSWQSLRASLRLDLSKVVTPYSKNENASQIKEGLGEFSPSGLKNSPNNYFGHPRTHGPRPSPIEEEDDQAHFKLGPYTNVLGVSSERMPESYVRTIIGEKFPALRRLIKYYDLFTFTSLLLSFLVWIFAKEPNFSLMFLLVFLDGALISFYYWYYISPEEDEGINEIIMDVEKAERLEQIVMLQSVVSVFTLFILLIRGVLYFIHQLMGRSNRYHSARPWMRHSKRYMTHLFFSVVLGMVLHFVSFLVLDRIGKMSSFWKINLEKLSPNLHHHLLE